MIPLKYFKIDDKINLTLLGSAIQKIKLIVNMQQYEEHKLEQQK